jgi:four helix bundle protein
MSRFKSYRDLEVWQKAMVVAKVIYQATSAFPSDEKFGLVNQMRRASVSIPSNIAEGHARSSTADFQRFISIAMGSVAELETQIILSTDLSYLTSDHQVTLLRELDDIGKMLRGLHRSLGNRTSG